ncbi:IPT/TIG domain-containing protein [Algoriphagus confluentis]|uniref:IPT/TIG domain-containing protein n=1 Tax=Algoriphagus confluentis TaxID=1697556 RepID=A0ABQ6PMR4_9BACT|nr:hypothetical protein Aconfl_14700 [Algoriphagus confluentis]
MRKLLSLSLLLVLIGGWACTEEVDTPIIVATEDVLFVGGTNVRLSGRLITNREVTATDHGFLISESEAFSSPITISLGTKDGPGRFIGETSGLRIAQQYWVKAFSEVDGEQLFGAAVPIRTLTPQLDGYFPNFSRAGELLTIEGRNLSEDTQVFFGTQEAQIVSNVFESRLTVRIPPATENSLVPLRLQIQGEIFEFPQPFEYQAGRFTLVGLFPESFRIYNTVSFTNQAGFHVGLGNVRLSSSYSKIQRFDPSTLSWSEVNFPGNPRSFAFATSGYLGGGAVELGFNSFEFDRSFWQINGSTFEQLADLPFQGREQLAMEINGELFVMGGIDPGANDIWKYSPNTKSWAKVATAPFVLHAGTPHFVYQNKGYVVNTSGQLFEFDSQLLSWNFKTVYPGSLGEGYGMAAIDGNKAWVGLYRRSQEIFELDLNTFSWKAKNPFEGFPRSINLGSFVYQGEIYILRGPEISVTGELPLELFKFDPNGL